MPSSTHEDPSTKSRLGHPGHGAAGDLLANIYGHDKEARWPYSTTLTERFGFCVTA